MIKVIIEVDAPTGQVIGIKEDIAVYLEQFGDARVVEIVVDPGEQLQLKGVGRCSSLCPSTRWGCTRHGSGFRK